MKLIPILTFFGLAATINAYPSVKGVPNQVSDVKGLKGIPPSPGHYDRPSKVGQVRDDVKGVKTVPVVQQHQQQVQDDIKGVPQLRDPVKGFQQRDPVKSIAQHPIKGQHPVVSQRRPYQPVKGYPQQKEDEFKGGKSLVQQQPQQYPEAKGVSQRPQRPHYPVKGYPHSTQQQVNDDFQQRQQPVFPVKGQRKTRSVNYEQDFDQTKVGQGVKGRKGGIKSVPKSPTKNIPRVKGKSVDDVKVVQQQEAKVADVQVKSDEQVKTVQEAVPVVSKVSQEKVAQEPAVVQEKIVAQQAVPQEVSQEKVVVQEAVKVPQEAVKDVPEVVKPEQVKDVQVKGLDEPVQIKDEAVKGQTVGHVVVAVANGVGSGVDGASVTASASAVVVLARDEPQVKEETKAIKSDEPKQGRHLSKVGSPVKGVPFYRKKITQQRDNTPVQQQHEQQVVQQDQTVQSD